MRYPFRVGTTSYIIEDDLVANARFLADKVADMQLVLFELADGTSNLPSPQEVQKLAKIGQLSGLTYSVHLIDDLPASDTFLAERTLPAMQRARRLIELFAPLSPSTYVLHLDGLEMRTQGYPPEAMRKWQSQTSASLRQLAHWVGNSNLLAVENLEGYPPELVTPIVNATCSSRCVDIGHLWLDGHDPLPYLQSALPCTRIVHLHGLKGGRDHQSIAEMPAEKLDPVIRCLLDSGYMGIVTLEIFGQADFQSSMLALQASLERCL